MFIPFKQRRYLLEYLVEFQYPGSQEVLETKAYIYADSNPQTSIPKLFPGVVVLGYEPTGERIDI